MGYRAADAEYKTILVEANVFWRMKLYSYFEKMPLPDRTKN